MNRRSDEFETFYRAVFPRAVSVALRIAGNKPDAEDAAVEAMAKAHYHWRRIGSAPWRESWVFKVTINEAIRRLPKPLSNSPTITSPDPTDDIALRLTLFAALQALPQRQREAIVLRYLLGLSEVEVASAMGVSHNTFKTHMRRGMSGMRKSLGPELQEDHLVQLA